MPLTGAEKETVREALNVIEDELDTKLEMDAEWATGPDYKRIEFLTALSGDMRNLLRMPKREG